MARFKYKIIDSAKQTRSGEVEGESLDKVADNLLSQGFTILYLKSAGINWEKLKNITIGGIPLKERVTFMRQMSFMVSAGLPLVQALDIAKNQVKSFEFKEIMSNVIKEVEGGSSLANSFAKYPKAFDAITINLIRAGEESGKLDMIIERLAEDMERQQEFRGKLIGAMIYPVIVLLAIIAVVIALMVYMVPQMSELYASQNAELPLVTQVVVSMSDFLTKGMGGIITGVAILFLIVAFIYYRSTPSGLYVTDKYFLKFPVFGELLAKSNVASFARTFSMLITAGIPILDALKLVGDATTHSIFKKDIFEARSKVEKGLPLSAPISNSAGFPEMVGKMMRVGEETGKIDEVIAKVGERYAKEVDQMASNLSKLIEPMVIIVMGVVIGGLALAVYMPMLTLGQTISR